MRLDPKTFSPIKNSYLYSQIINLSEINDYPDFYAEHYLRTDVTNGFQLNYIGSRVHVKENNLKSVVVHHGSLLEEVNMKIALGRILGQFSIDKENAFVPSGTGSKIRWDMAYDYAYLYPSNCGIVTLL